MRKPLKTRIQEAKNIQRYHCIKFIEGIANRDLGLADRHLTKLIERKLASRIAYALKNTTLI